MADGPEPGGKPGPASRSRSPAPAVSAPRGPGSRGAQEISKLSGPHRATVVLTRVNDKPWGLICTDPGTPTPAG